jgi:hypothetical protein
VYLLDDGVEDQGKVPFKLIKNSWSIGLLLELISNPEDCFLNRLI